MKTSIRLRHLVVQHHVLLFAVGALMLRTTQAEPAVNLPPPASGVARDIHGLHDLILWICLGIFVTVCVPLFIALIRHRKSRGHPPARFHDNRALEIAWTVVPTLILVGMAWPATRLVMAMKDTSKEDLTIKVTGYQWKWEYEYLGEGIRFMSLSSTPKEQIGGAQEKGEHYLLEVDRPLVVPAGKKIRLVTTSSDVIHSWAVPALGVKQDAIPGFIRDTWFRADTPGIYRGQCTELCGMGHGFMPVVVNVLTPEDFAAWMSNEKAQLAAATAGAATIHAPEALIAQGEKVYAANCMVCHQPTGLGIPNVFPALAGSKIATGEKNGHIDIVLNGKANTAMAAFGKQLSDVELAAVITYERNSWGNHTGDAVQPADVAARRKSAGVNP